MSTMQASDTPAAFSAGANPAPTVSLRLLFLLILLLASTASLANGRIGPFNVYTIDGRFADPDRTSTLYRIDPDTGEVLETIGDTGLRLNAITMWPQGSRMIGVTSADDPEYPDHLVEIDQATARVVQLIPLYDASGRAPAGDPPAPVTPFDFQDVAVFESRGGHVSLALIRRSPSGDGNQQAVLWETDEAPRDSLPGGAVRHMIWAGYLVPGLGSSGQFGIANADWDQVPRGTLHLDVAMIGCVDSESSIEAPRYGGPPITPPEPDVGGPLSHPSCFEAALRIGINTWLGVMLEPGQGPLRRLAVLELEPAGPSGGTDAVDLQDLGPLPDNTVGIAFGPAFPVEPVPALSRMALIVLLGLVALVVVLRLRREQRAGTS